MIRISHDEIVNHGYSNGEYQILQSYGGEGTMTVRGLKNLKWLRNDIDECIKELENGGGHGAAFMTGIGHGLVFGESEATRRIKNKAVRFHKDGEENDWEKWAKQLNKSMNKKEEIKMTVQH